MKSAFAENEIGFTERCCVHIVKCLLLMGLLFFLQLSRALHRLSRP